MSIEKSSKSGIVIQGILPEKDFGLSLFGTTHLQSCPMVAHTHPFGNLGRFEVSGRAGSLYFFPGCSVSHFFFLSTRMRFNHSLAGSTSGFFLRHCSVSFPSTAALRTEVLYRLRFACMRFSAVPASSRRENCFSISATMSFCWSRGARGIVLDLIKSVGTLF